MNFQYEILIKEEGGDETKVSGSCAPKDLYIDKDIVEVSSSISGHDCSIPWNLIHSLTIKTQ
jgi:hypothetical protein